MKLPKIKQSGYILIPIIFFLILQPIHGQDNKNTGTIHADQFHLNYIIEGEGKPAIVIGSSIYYPRAFSQNLRNHLKFIFLDHRGFAPNPGNVDTSNFSLDKIIEDIELTRLQLNLGKIIIIGHSGHSYMALEYAKKYPKNVTNVVMIGISPNLSKSSEKLIEQNWKESVNPESKKILKDNFLRLPDEKLSKLSPSQAFIQSYIRNGPRAWYDPQFDSSPLWEGIEINMDMFIYMWGRVFRDIEITKGIDDFHQPIFLALGRYDYLVGPPSEWESIRSQFHDLTVRVFEKSGHTPQYEQPVLFDKELINWLQLKKK